MLLAGQGAIVLQCDTIQVYLALIALLDCVDVHVLSAFNMCSVSHVTWPSV